MNPFPPELRTAAIIPRWSVVWTLNKDTVSNHSFFVALYAYQIAILIGWRGDRSELLFDALTHDLEEIYTGDVVSPTKRAIVDFVKSTAYVRKKMRDTMPSILDQMDGQCQSMYAEDSALIVKAADRLDAVLFLTVELRMGNKHVFSRCQDARQQLEDAWMRLPVDEDDIHARSGDYLEHLWHDVVLPAIKEHEEVGGSGV